MKKISFSLKTYKIHKYIKAPKLLVQLHPLSLRNKIPSPFYKSLGSQIIKKKIINLKFGLDDKSYNQRLGNYPDITLYPLNKNSIIFGISKKTKLSLNMDLGHKRVYEKVIESKKQILLSHNYYFKSNVYLEIHKNKIKFLLSVQHFFLSPGLSEFEDLHEETFEWKIKV